MKIRTLFDRLFPQTPVPTSVAPFNNAGVAKKRLKVSQTVLAQAMAAIAQDEKNKEESEQIKPYSAPKGVLPSDYDTKKIAMDFAPNYEYLNATYFGMGFMGYPTLAMFTQQPEYRKISGVIAEEMTRKWIEIVNVGDEDKAERINEIEKAMRKFKVRDVFRQAAELDGFFGRGQIYIDVKTPGGAIARDLPLELKSQLTITADKIVKDSLLGFKIIEPVWTYPAQYNSNKPLAPDYYKPSSWYVMSQEVHASRLLLFVSRDVPDMLKPAYNFGGVSMSQLAKPYVDNWLRTRQSVSDMLHSFSLSGIKTDMGSALEGGEGAEMFNRAKLFTQLRDNRNLLLIDKEAEEFFQFNVPLSGLDALQAQAQEQMASVASIPLVKLLGITPAGLNASADPEIRAFYDYLAGLQENIFRDPLKVVIDVIQLSTFGDIDPDINFKFVELWQMSALELAQIRKSDAETDNVLVSGGIIVADESRARLASDPDSGYDGLELNAVLPDDADLTGVDDAKQE